VKKYARRKVVVGNSLMIRDGIGLHAVTGNVRAYGEMWARKNEGVARFCDKRHDYTLSRRDRDTCLEEEVSSVVSRSNYNGNAHSALSPQVERVFFRAL